jgi:uncharacterized protein YjcR
MAELDMVSYDIEQLYLDGLTEKNIAKTLDISVEMVYAWMEINGISDTADAAEWDELEAFDPADY